MLEPKPRGMKPFCHRCSLSQKGNRTSEEIAKTCGFPSEVSIRVSKKGQKFQTLKILTKRGKFLLFGLKAFQKCRNHKKILIFRYRYLMSKFLEKLLSKITIFSSKMKWNFEMSLFSFFSISN